MNDSKYMEEAVRLAQHGMLSGDGGPFGAVIVRKGEIVGKGWNKVLKTNDPTAHAEIVAIREASARLDSYWLEDCHIYSNCEPCPMCLAAIYWARISKLTYGATRKDAAEIGFDDNTLYREVCLPVDGRTLRATQLCRKEALQVMRIWPEMAEKQQY